MGILVVRAQRKKPATRKLLVPRGAVGNLEPLPAFTSCAIAIRREATKRLTPTRRRGETKNRWNSLPYCPKYRIGKRAKPRSSREQAAAVPVSLSLTPFTSAQKHITMICSPGTRGPREFWKHWLRLAVFWPSEFSDEHSFMVQRRNWQLFSDGMLRRLPSHRGSGAAYP